jgi:hypothetical protein
MEGGGFILLGFGHFGLNVLDLWRGVSGIVGAQRHSGPTLSTVVAMIAGAERGYYLAERLDFLRMRDAWGRLAVCVAEERGCCWQSDNVGEINDQCSGRMKKGAGMYSPK